MPRTSMRAWARSLRTRIWRATFFELGFQALPAQAVAAGDGLKRRQLLAPAGFLVRAAAERLLAPGAGQLPHARSVPGLEILRTTPISWVLLKAKEICRWQTLRDSTRSMTWSTI